MWLITYVIGVFYFVWLHIYSSGRSPCGVGLMDLFLAILLSFVYNIM